jgi:Mg2+-importing ATPase
VREVVPGDVVLLSAGDLVPADAVVLASTDLFVNQAVLTGESFPVDKRPGTAPAAATLSERANCVFLGTNVRTGTARCLVIDTGGRTQCGGIAKRLALRPPETEFDRGLRHFGYLLARSMFVMILFIFSANMLLGRPAGETLLFAVALAVGLSPELLPAVLTVNLARGAQMMARHGVLVRRLNAIENLGSMDILCTDKTGTLTEGVVRLDGTYDDRGEPSQAVLEVAAINASLQSGLTNPLDEAIVQAHAPHLDGVSKLAEVPYDFVRKRMSVVVRRPDGVVLLTKGAVEHVLEACVRCEGGAALDAERLRLIRANVGTWNDGGARVLAVARRTLDEKPA